MTQMVRKQVYIESHQERRLKKIAQESGVTEADLFRRGLNLALEQNEVFIRDAEAWREELAFIKKRARLPALGRKREWSREELYESRLSRRH